MNGVNTLNRYASSIDNPTKSYDQKQTKQNFLLSELMALFVSKFRILTEFMCMLTIVDARNYLLQN